LAGLEWGLINSGGCFESLVHALLYAEDPQIILFGRPGRDSGQDARSADGRVVYQAKYHQGMNMSNAINDALSELEKIKRYKTPEHTNFQHWQAVEKWVLVGNFDKNPNDEAKWQKQVVPAFREIGLEIDYWSKEKLEGKLSEQPHVCDVFFKGNNRVLTGLKEAYDILSSTDANGDFTKSALIGRKKQLNAILDFAEKTEQSILPVVGGSGSGKSRLLYESLLALHEKEWRVFWGLPEAMKKSTKWFEFLNDKKPTIVAIDNVDDAALMKGIIEQLRMSERKNWKIICSLYSEKAESLLRFGTEKMLAKPILLPPLSEADSKKMLNNLLGFHADEVWAHKVFGYTGGVPGWLSLVASLKNKNCPIEQIDSIEAVAESFLSSFLGTYKEKEDILRCLLRCLSLVGFNDFESKRFYLSNSDVVSRLHIIFPHTLNCNIEPYLKILVNNGLVGNAMQENSLYAVKPQIFREYILSEWLLVKSENEYSVNEEGKRLLDLLLTEKLRPAKEILETLARLSLSRLKERDGFNFFRNVFDLFSEKIRNGNIKDQDQVVNLISRAGSVDVERSLELIKEVRENPKASQSFESLWGEQALYHENLLAEIPWVLFNLAIHVKNENIAMRYLYELREYFLLDAFGKVGLEPEKGLKQLETSGKIEFESGKSPKQLLLRLLSGSYNWKCFAKAGKDILFEELPKADIDQFIFTLALGLLNPEKEFMEFSETSHLNFYQIHLPVDSEEWKNLIALREFIWEQLKNSVDSEKRCLLWEVLAESHSKLWSTINHGFKRGEAHSEYEAVLLSDLQKADEILQNILVEMSLAETQKARKLWSCHVEFAEEEEGIKKLAQSCEKIIREASKWKLHDFFGTEGLKYAEWEKLVEPVAGKLLSATTMDEFTDFFHEVKNYIDNADRIIGADDQLLSLAKKLRVQFDPFFVGADSISARQNPLTVNPCGINNAITDFVFSVLQKKPEENIYAWNFTMVICRYWLLQCKKTEFDIEILKRFISEIKDKAAFIYSLYINAHPDVIGIMTQDELEFISIYEADFTTLKWFSLLGVFAGAYWEKVQILCENYLQKSKNAQRDFTEEIKLFINSMYNSCVHRYKLPVHKSQIKWLIDVICQYELNASLMDMYEFKALRDEAGFKMNMPEFLEFLVSRGKIDLSPKNSDPFYRLSSDFRTVEWCFFDKEDSEEIQAFYKICALLSESEFIYKYTLPKYIADLDQGAVYTAQFITDFFSQTINPEIEVFEALAELAAIHSDDSQEWHKIAEPICKKALLLNRNDRESIYFTLYHGDRTTALYNMPGQVNDHYYQAVKKARKLLEGEKSETLKEYREWVLERAEKILRHEKEMAGLDTEEESEFYPEEDIGSEQDTDSKQVVNELDIVTKIDKAQHSVFELKQMQKNGKIILRPGFQRRFVWNEKQKSELIESVLMGVPLPAIYLLENRYGQKEVLDGLQRLSTFFAYMDNEFALQDLKILQNLNGKRFNELKGLLRSRIDDHKILIHIIQPSTPDIIKLEIFKRVNRGGTTLNAQEIRNALYNGKSTELLQKLSHNDFFLKLTDGLIDIKRMRDHEIILRFISLYLQHKDLFAESKIDYKIGLDNFMGKVMYFLNRQDDAFNEKIVNIFDTTMKFCLENIGVGAFCYEKQSGGKFFSPSLYEALSCLIALLTEQQINWENKELKQELLQFREKMNTAEYSGKAISSVEKRYFLVETSYDEICRKYGKG
jgi:hypothetical protein